MARTIDFLTVARSDFGRYRPILTHLAKSSSVRARVLVGGNHAAPRFGSTISEIAASGFEYLDGFTVPDDGDSPAAVGRSIAFGTNRLTEHFAADAPCALVLLGDRFEMLSGANAALGFDLPVVHIHGGAVTEGALDERVRHALTKMSHAHLVSCEQYAARLRQMGEEAWRVHVTGAPGLDELAQYAQIPIADVSRAIGLDVSKPTVLVSFHPITLQSRLAGAHTRELLQAMETIDEQIVLTYPNTDPGHSDVIREFERFHRENMDRTVLVKNVGTMIFSAILAHAKALIGNSSTGIVEAATFELPVVNIGSRQDGKVKPANVIDTEISAAAISAALRRALDPDFRADLRGLPNPYGDGNAGPRIATFLSDMRIDAALMRKKFIDQ